MIRWTVAELSSHGRWLRFVYGMYLCPTGKINELTLRER